MFGLETCEKIMETFHQELSEAIQSEYNMSYYNSVKLANFLIYRRDSGKLLEILNKNNINKVNQFYEIFNFAKEINNDKNKKWRYYNNGK